MTNPQQGKVKQPHKIHASAIYTPIGSANSYNNPTHPCPRSPFCRLVLEDGSVWHGTAFGHTGSEGKDALDTMHCNFASIPCRRQGYLDNLKKKRKNFHR